MPTTDINLWAIANDWTGDTLRAGWGIINNNFWVVQADLTTHINDNTNPHSVTKSQVGLSEVDNTSDSQKPISTAAAAKNTTQDNAIALNTAKVWITPTQASDITANNAKNTYPSWDASKVSNLPADQNTVNTTLQSNIDTKQDTLVSGTNIKTINGDSVLWSGNIVITWGGAVDSVNTQTGVVVLTTWDIAEDTDKNYITDTEKTVIGNTSGVNTGDQDISGIATNATDIDNIELKTDFITVTQAVNLDTIESDTADNTSNRNLVKVSANDTTWGVLNWKLVAWANISFVEWNDWGDETLTISSTGWTGDTITTTVNTIKKDSTAGTWDTYWILAWAVNGVNTTYTTSAWVFVSGSLTVYRNGKRLVQGTWEDWVETTPWSWIFDFNTAPETWDVLDVEYSDQDVTSNALIVDKDVQTVTTNYTALQTDWIIFVDASSWAITITLPATSWVDRVGIVIKKVDSSWNSVTIATPWSETIDNASTSVLNTPFQSQSIGTDWTNYFIL